MKSKNTVDGTGYVSLSGTSLSESDLKEIQKNFFRGGFNHKLLHLPVVHLEIKCPIYVRLIFGEHRLTTITKQDKTFDAFIPSVDMINSGNHENDIEIQQSIEQNTEALLLSPKGYKMDGCDTFIANSILPVSTYNTLIVSGTLYDWLQLIDKTAPSTIQPYINTINDILNAEYNYYVAKYGEKV